MGLYVFASFVPNDSCMEGDLSVNRRSVAEINRLRSLVMELGGDPDEPEPKCDHCDKRPVFFQFKSCGGGVSLCEEHEMDAD